MTSFVFGLALAFLHNYRGVFQTDGYAGYTKGT